MTEWLQSLYKLLSTPPVYPAAIHHVGMWTVRAKQKLIWINDWLSRVHRHHANFIKSADATCHTGPWLSACLPAYPPPRMHVVGCSVGFSSLLACGWLWNMKRKRRSYHPTTTTAFAVDIAGPTNERTNWWRWCCWWWWYYLYFWRDKATEHHPPA